MNRLISSRLLIFRYTVKRNDYSQIQSQEWVSYTLNFQGCIFSTSWVLPSASPSRARHTASHLSPSHTASSSKPCSDLLHGGILLGGSSLPTRSERHQAWRQPSGEIAMQTPTKQDTDICISNKIGSLREEFHASSGSAKNDHAAEVRGPWNNS